MQTLIAIRLTRSRIGLAVFSTAKLEFVRCLNLPCSSMDDAAKSLRGTLSWAIEQFEEPTLAIEQADSPDHDALISEIREFARESGLPFQAVPIDMLLKAYSYPHLKSRNELRKSAASIWPALIHTEKGEILDAVALGLYLQAQRLLSPEN